MGFYQDRIFPWLCQKAVRDYDDERRAVFGSASGRVLEIGFGLGTSFRFYTDSADEIVGLEYSASMLTKAEKELDELKANSALASKVILIKGSATNLDFPDESFDTVVSFLVFCSVPDPELAASEIYRVLKPNGKLHFFEHVLAADETLAKWQRRLNPFWKKIACGCNLTRDTKSLFLRAGFSFENFKEYVHENSMKISRQKIQGIAVKS